MEINTISLTLKIVFCMKKVTRTMSLPISKTAFAFLFAFFLLALGCKKSNERNALKDFHQVNLVDNNGSYGAALHNPTLRNAWGIAFSPGGIAWVNANAGHVSELFDQDGNPIRTPVNIPSPLDTIGGTPTGIVFNSTPDFLLSDGGKALFIFVGDDGVLSGWNQAAGNNALRIKNNASTAVYKGLALASSGGANFLYAADFKTGKIDVWDKNFTPVNMSFSDPNLPSGYAPFNIQLVGNWLVVLYAKVGPEGDEETGQGFGFVNIFNTDGSFVKRFASRGCAERIHGVLHRLPLPSLMIMTEIMMITKAMITAWAKSTAMTITNQSYWSAILAMAASMDLVSMENSSDS